MADLTAMREAASNFETTIRINLEASTETILGAIETKLVQGVTQEALALQVEMDLLRGSGDIIGNIFQELDTRWNGVSAEVRTRNLTIDYPGSKALERVCISDNNSCIDCLYLHGVVKSLKQWQADGLMPGQGGTVCGGNCRCQLIPSDQADASVKDPINLKSGKSKPRDEAIQQILARPSTDSAAVIQRASAAGVDIAHLGA